MLRLLTALTAAGTVALATAGSAAGAVAHTVAPGETLWSIASASNLTNRALAAYNGLEPEGHVVLGSTIMVPSPAEAHAAMVAAGMLAAPAGASAPAEPGAGAAHAHPHEGPAPDPIGAYTVRWGDTLSGIAATARVPAAHIAQMNGLDPSAPLLAGTVIKLPTGSPAPSGAAQPAPAARVVPPADPRPTHEHVDAATIGGIASAHGVPASLAAAVAWQESGFDNAMVSSANARGVMQVMPGTWNWIQENLAAGPLDPASAHDNVHAGVMYLARLLSETGGDEDTAVAGYYQGLGAVRSRGLFEDTKRYVANVRALRPRFGG